MEASYAVRQEPRQNTYDIDRTSDVSATRQRIGVSNPDCAPSEEAMKPEASIRSSGGLRQEIVIGPHRLVADEPPEHGGQDAGPSPFGLLTAALGS